MPLRTGRRDWLWGVALGLLILAAIFFAVVALKPSNVKTYETVAGVDCQTGERLEYLRKLPTLSRSATIPVARPSVELGGSGNLMSYARGQDDRSRLSSGLPQSQP